jgi:hypothetical protein
MFASLSSCTAEFVESFRQPIGSGPVGRSRWQGQESAVHFLKAVPEHRPIDFIHEGTIDVDDVIRRDTEQVCVESSVVDLAEAQTILDYRKAVLFVVADDVGSIEELAVPECADGALCLVREEDASSEFGLMETLFDDSFSVFAFGGFELQRVGDEAKAFVEGEDKSSIVSVVCDYIDRNIGTKMPGRMVRSKMIGRPSSMARRIFRLSPSVLPARQS